MLKKTTAQETIMLFLVYLHRRNTYAERLDKAMLVEYAIAVLTENVEEKGRLAFLTKDRDILEVHKDCDSNPIPPSFLSIFH